MTGPDGDWQTLTFHGARDPEPIEVGAPVYAIDEETGLATVVAHVSEVADDGTVTITGGKPEA